MNLNKEEEEIKTACGGYCSLIQIALTVGFFGACYKTISIYAEYDVSQSLIFYDVDDLQINFTESIKDFSFGFKWKSEQVDMIDNEFVTLKLNYERKLS